MSAWVARRTICGCDPADADAVAVAEIGELVDDVSALARNAGTLGGATLGVGPVVTGFCETDAGETEAGEMAVLDDSPFGDDVRDSGCVRVRATAACDSDERDNGAAATGGAVARLSMPDTVVGEAGDSSTV